MHRVAVTDTLHRGCVMAGRREGCGGRAVLWVGSMNLCAACAQSDVGQTAEKSAPRSGPSTSTPLTPLDDLQRIRRARARLDTSQADAVRRARAGGQSWANVAAALGVSAQAAHKRYGP